MEAFSLQGLTPETIIFGGLTLVSLALITLVWRVIVRYGNHTNTIIDRNTDAWIKQTRSHERQSSSIDRLTDMIDKKLGDKNK